MGRMTTQKMMDISLAECRANDGRGEYHHIREQVKVFEAAVWFPKLQAAVNATDSRGLGGVVRGVKVMTWCCAGRCLIQFERDSHRITLITADDEKPWQRDMAHVAPLMGPMGIQSIDAEAVEAMRMIYEATRWADELELRPDDNITIG
jgi:hypothetical protein